MYTNPLSSKGGQALHLFSCTIQDSGFVYTCARTSSIPNSCVHCLLSVFISCRQPGPRFEVTSFALGSNPESPESTLISTQDKPGTLGSME